jgi:hypothetical protein
MKLLTGTFRTIASESRKFRARPLYACVPYASGLTFDLCSLGDAIDKIARVLANVRANARLEL